MASMFQDLVVGLPRPTRSKEKSEPVFTSENKVFYEQFTRAKVCDALKTRPLLEQIKDGLMLETVEDLILRILNGTWEHETLLPRDWEDRINFYALFGALLKNTTNVNRLLVAKCHVSLAKHFANIANQHKQIDHKATEKQEEQAACLQQFGEQIAQLSQTMKTGNKDIAAAVVIDINMLHANGGSFKYDWNDGALKVMEKSGIGGNMYRLIKNMVSNRPAPIIDERIKGYQPNGLPAESPLTQTLWKMYTNDLLKVTKSKSTYFGDDLVFSRTGRNLHTIEKALDEDLDRLKTYCKQKKFEMFYPSRIYYTLK